MENKPLYEVCLIRIMEQVGQKRATVCRLLLKNISNKHNKYIVNKKNSSTFGQIDEVLRNFMTSAKEDGGRF
jgi:hypothetical protein